MNNNARQNEKLKRILSIIIITIGATLLAAIVMLVSHRNYDSIDLSGEWYGTINGQDYDKQSIWDIPFSTIEPGTEFVMSTILPEESIKQPTLVISISHSACEVFLDGEQIYSYGMEEYKNDTLLGSGYHYVYLPDEYEGKELTVVLYATDVSSFNRIEDISIWSSQDVFYHMVSENVLVIAVCFFLVVAGILTLGGAAFVIKRKISSKIYVGASLFSILIAIWLSCNTQVIQLLGVSFHRITVIEYISLYLAPGMALLFAQEMLKREREKKIVNGMAILFFSSASVAFLLQIFGIRKLPQELLGFQVAMMLALATVLVCIVKEAKMRKEKADQIMNGGMIVFLIYIFIEIVRYIIQRYFDVRTMFSTSILPVGLLCFIVSAFLGVVYRIIQHRTEDIERVTLKKIAYTDPVTQINNRAKCEEILWEYEKNRKPVLIINMDLNDFKEANDQCGHTVGDHLLMEFAKILQEVYDEVGNVGRMGGDEFIVIMDPMDKTEVQKLIVKVKRKIQQRNADRDAYNMLSFAYGYATNEEDTSCTPWKVYEKADAAMYQCKRKQKKSRTTIGA